MCVCVSVLEECGRSKKFHKVCHYFTMYILYVCLPLKEIALLCVICINLHHRPIDVLHY